MIEKGNTIVLATKLATYSPCRVVAISPINITVLYVASSKEDSGVNRKTETIPLKNVTHMSERK